MKRIKIFAAFSIMLFVSAGCYGDPSKNNVSPEQVLEDAQQTNQNQPAASATSNNEPPTTVPDAKEVVAPISRASERVTKKPFGIYITKQNSPVQPEKFNGYHSGTDFETFPEEKDADVAINTVCSGKIAAKRIATGYGGVVTQYCTIDNQAVTVIYGHVRLSSVGAKAGDSLAAGAPLGLLGTGYSAETDGERKHLHLGIVKGQGTDIRGYVAQKPLLNSFINIINLF